MVWIQFNLTNGKLLTCLKIPLRNTSSIKDKKETLSDCTWNISNQSLFYTEEITRTTKLLSKMKEGKSVLY